MHFTAGSEGNEITGNAFVNNRNQVKYVGSRFLDWSKDGRGNYWSDNPAFDLNGDGIADSPYRPNDVMDKVLWTVPNAKILSIARRCRSFGGHSRSSRPCSRAASSTAIR